MTPTNNDSQLFLALPKGRIQEGVNALLKDAGISMRIDARGYRPQLQLSGFDCKILKPQNIVEMLNQGTRDIGFAGADWVRELDADVVELVDTELDPVRIVVAAAEEILEYGSLPKRQIVVASEYENLTRKWIAENNIEAIFVRSYGATEVFPPEDADCIVDNTATGSTLRANNLRIMDELMTSSTRLYASKRAYANPAKRRRIDDLVLLLRAVLEARGRVLVELNLAEADLPKILEILPCMRRPTIAPLGNGGGVSVKAAVPRRLLPEVIPVIKSCGGMDILVTGIDQIVP